MAQRLAHLVVEKANKMMGFKSEGTLPEQAAKLCAELEICE